MIQVQLERENAEAVLAILERRLETIHEIEREGEPIFSPAIEAEKAVITSTIMALEAALKIPPYQ